jgi:hypothetical protein
MSLKGSTLAKAGLSALGSTPEIAVDINGFLVWAGPAIVHDIEVKTVSRSRSSSSIIFS